MFYENLQGDKKFLDPSGTLGTLVQICRGKPDINLSQRVFIKQVNGVCGRSVGRKGGGGRRDTGAPLGLILHELEGEHGGGQRFERESWRGRKG